MVAPHVGAWIETHSQYIPVQLPFVAPHVGAWIETKGMTQLWLLFLVAPHVGAWIETDFAIPELDNIGSRTPCGCVD